MGWIKELFKSIKSIRENNAIAKKYFNMSADELKKLSNDELYDAVFSILYFSADNEEIDKYNSVQLTILTVMNFDAEVNNGGLCQFFVNSSRVYAPYVIDSFNTINAPKVSELFSKFVEENKIELNDLSSFLINSIKEYKAQTERYPFDDFDNCYYEIDHITELLIEYIRNNIELSFEGN